MITDSPHLYRRVGEKNQVAESVISASLIQARSVEDHGLPAVLTLKHLAHRTGASYGYLRNIAERRVDPYTDLSIARRNGRPMRAISIPDPILMDVQRWILDRILAMLSTHHNSYAYAQGTSIRQCAEKHLGAKWLVKLDIRDFFQSINEARVYSVFNTSGYQPLVSLELARICTRYAGHAAHIDQRRFVAHPHYTSVRAYSRPLLGFLPQGAPTSGALANQVAWPLDVKLTKLADSNGAVYTRYADDLILSSLERFDRGLAQDIIVAARKILESERFILHEQKTSIITPGARKIVLGLLVDGDRVRISRRMRTRLISHIRGIETFGLSRHVEHSKFVSIDGFVRHVSGLLAFIYDIEPDWSVQMQNRWQAALRANRWIERPLFI